MVWMVLLEPAGASHTVITPNDIEWNVTSNNGVRVYLSSPRHSDSGNRGELGWEENINGRHWNNYAANGNYVNGHYSTNTFRNLRVRTYAVRLSGNARDSWVFNRDASYAWGSDVHLVTHTNAGGGNYLLVMYDADDPQSGLNLASLLRDRLDPHLPGVAVAAPDVQYTYNSISLGELDDHSLAAPHRAFTELIFHDNASHVSYLGSGWNWWGAVALDAWRYGRVIDEYLGYPR